MKREEAKEMFRADKDSYGKPKAIMHKIDQIFDDFEKDKEKICILRCKTCAHWTQRTNWDYEGAINSGKCRELPNDQLQVELHTGWDGGYVDYIETEETFGCTEHSEYKKIEK